MIKKHKTTSFLHTTLSRSIDCLLTVLMTKTETSNNISVKYYLSLFYHVHWILCNRWWIYIQVFDSSIDIFLIEKKQKHNIMFVWEVYVVITLSLTQTLCFPSSAFLPHKVMCFCNHKANRDPTKYFYSYHKQKITWIHVVGKFWRIAHCCFALCRNLPLIPGLGASSAWPVLPHTLFLGFFISINYSYAGPGLAVLLFSN